MPAGILQSHSPGIFLDPMPATQAALVLADMPEQMMTDHRRDDPRGHDLRGEGPDMRTLHREGPPGQEGVSVVIPAGPYSEQPSQPEQQKLSKTPFSAASEPYADTDDTSNTDSTSDGNSTSTAGEYEAGYTRARCEPHEHSLTQHRQPPGNLRGLPENETVLAGLPNDEDMDGFVGGSTSALDCTDPSVTDTWATLRTLNASSRSRLDLLGLGYSADQEGIDFIAP